MQQPILDCVITVKCIAATSNINRMSQYAIILQREFPAIDNELKDYVEGVLTGSEEDFHTCDDIFDAVGDILQGIDGEKSEESIRRLCDEFFNIIKNNSKNVEHKVLNAPVNIEEMARNMERMDKDMQSIWVVNKDGANVSNYSHFNDAAINTVNNYRKWTPKSWKKRKLN